MLVDFKVTNFRSFNGTVDFSMETGEKLRKFSKTNTFKTKHGSLLKNAVVFGGNANGKTNLLIAMRFLRQLLISPTVSNLQNLPTDTFGYNDGNTEFDITFIKNEKKYRYQLTYNQNIVISESLKINDKIYLSRLDNEIVSVPNDLKPLIKGLRENQLLLFFAQASNDAEATAAFSWFIEDLVFVDTDVISIERFKSLNKPEFKEKFLSFLQAADFNIIDVEVLEKKVQTPQVNFKLVDNIVSEANHNYVDMTVYELYSTHSAKNGEFKLFFDNESSGTKVFIVLAFYILQNELANKVLLIDEFDRSFHVELAQALMTIFNSEKQGNQFVLTTHELALMDYNLRPDQIWFAEKNRYGETELFSVFDFDDKGLKRSDFGYKKRYLEGRYGASQIINMKALKDSWEG